MKKTCCIYMMECYAAVNKSEIMPFEVREREMSYDIPCMWNLRRNDTKGLKKHKETHRLRKLIYYHGRRIVSESGMDMDTLLYLTRSTSKDLLDSTGDSAQSSVITLWFPGGLQESGQVPPGGGVGVPSW